MEKASMEEVLWKDVRNVVAEHNITLADIIDEVNPGSNYILYKVNYPFGSEILKDGILQLPNHNGELVPFYDSTIKKSTQKNLSYNFGSNPVSLVLKNTTELFTTFSRRIIPTFGLISPGKIFGLWNILNSMRPEKQTVDKSVGASSLWGMTAGARSIFMLPKISKNISHRKLQQKLGIQQNVPDSLLDHWKIFRDIEQQSSNQSPWLLEILFFSDNWFKSLSQAKWHNVYRYFSGLAWTASDFWRYEFIWDIVFACIQDKLNIRPDPYITNTIKHLFAIAVGAVPGFAPATDTQAGPILGIQKVYNEIYNLEYYPIIMQPMSFLLNNKSSRSVYYSLEFPTTIELAPKTRTLASKIADLAQIQYLLRKFQEGILSEKLNLEDTPLYNAALHVKYDFFHSNVTQYRNIYLSRNIPDDDSTFLNNIPNKRAKFPENCPFVRGCIRISHSK